MSFKISKDHDDESFIIPPDLFGITKSFISIKLKHFMKEFQRLTDVFKVRMTWKTRNTQSLFLLKRYNLYFF